MHILEGKEKMGPGFLPQKHDTFRLTPSLLGLGLVVCDSKIFLAWVLCIGVNEHVGRMYVYACVVFTFTQVWGAWVLMCAVLNCIG